MMDAPLYRWQHIPCHFYQENIPSDWDQHRPVSSWDFDTFWRESSTSESSQCRRHRQRRQSAWQRGSPPTARSSWWSSPPAATSSHRRRSSPPFRTPGPFSSERPDSGRGLRWGPRRPECHRPQSLAHWSLWERAWGPGPPASLCPLSWASRPPPAPTWSPSSPSHSGLAWRATLCTACTRWWTCGRVSCIIMTVRYIGSHLTWLQGILQQWAWSRWSTGGLERTWRKAGTEPAGRFGIGFEVGKELFGNRIWGHLQIFWQLCSASVARVHCDEVANCWVHWDHLTRKYHGWDLWQSHLSHEVKCWGLLLDSVLDALDLDSNDGEDLHCDSVELVKAAPGSWKMSRLSTIHPTETLAHQSVQGLWRCFHKTCSPSARSSWRHRQTCRWPWAKGKPPSWKHCSTFQDPSLSLFCRCLQDPGGLLPSPGGEIASRWCNTCNEPLKRKRKITPMVWCLQEGGNIYRKSLVNVNSLPLA